MTIDRRAAEGLGIRERTGESLDLTAVALARQAEGDRDAATEVLRMVLPRVRSVVFRLAGRSPEAQDLVNRCLAEVYSNLSKFRGAGSLPSWAGGLSFRVVMRELKRRRRRQRTEILGAPDAAETSCSQATPETHLNRRRLVERLEKHLADLPPERRASLVLRLALGHSVAEVAQITGVPPNTARHRLQVGLRELRALAAADTELHSLWQEEQ